MFIPDRTIIDFWESSHQVRLFQTVRLFKTLEYDVLWGAFYHMSNDYSI